MNYLSLCFRNCYQVNPEFLACIASLSLEQRVHEGTGGYMLAYVIGNRG